MTAARDGRGRRASTEHAAGEGGRGRWANRATGADRRDGPGEWASRATGLRPAVADGLAAARAELIKLVTLPALALTVVLTWAVTAGLALLPEPGETGIRYARAGFVAFGALAAASEYAGGQLRSSLLCVPRRLELQAVKVLVLALAVLPVAAMTVLLAGTGDVLPLVLAALFASAVATLLRGAVPAVAVVLGYYYVLDPFVRFEPGPWLPAGALAAAAVVFARRDAGV